MKILSIPVLAHDSSCCIIEDGKVSSYIMEERFSRMKHDPRLDCILDELININQTKFDRIIISKSFFDKYVYNIDKLRQRLRKFKFDNLAIDDRNHHLYHAYSGFYNSGFEEALCFSVDATGAVVEGEYVEVETVYLLKKGQDEKIIHKKRREDFYDRTESKLSVGEKYLRISREFNYNPIDGAGKIMGLGQYKKHKEKLEYPYDTKEWKERVDKSYNLQQETQDYILSILKKCIEETGVKNIVISGGYGLNCVANYHYLKNLKDINLYVDPICFDAGICIGSAYHHYIHSTKNKLPQPIQNVYIGHKEETYDLSNLETEKVSYEDIVNLLLQKNIVALFQGKSEAGQRALGNRSLLFDARVSNGKDLVNQIKRRENFRPFAGSILLEEAHNWFNMLSLKESPYMQYAMDAYENAIEQVPAIIHADNTCRIQTVTQEQNEHFYNLIYCFFEKTRVPMLMNTSFNLGGEPLVETFEHAIYTLKNSMIEYLYLPEIETLITIKNKVLMYQ
jgi:carbamoyltransferase